MAGPSQATDNAGQTGTARPGSAQAGTVQAASVASIESLPFDGELIAHNRATGALCLLNSTAGAFLSLMQAGHTEAAAAALLAARYDVSRERIAADLAGLRVAWMEAGLLGAPEPDGLAQPQAEAAAPPVMSAAIDVTVSCGGAALRLRCEEPVLGALLGEVLRPALSDAAPEGGTVDLAGGEGAYQCWMGERLLWSCRPRPLARRNILREAIVRTLPGLPPAALLHASAVALDRRALVLAGDSGSGKTTLAAALVGQGARFIADDLMPLLPDGSLHPVPLAFSLKTGSWALLGPLFPAVPRLPVLESRGLKVRYLWPGNERAATSPQPPAAILFPAREPGAPPRWQALSPRQCLERLIATGTHLEAVPGALRALTRIAEETPAFSVRYDSLDDGRACVRSVLGEV